MIKNKRKVLAFILALCLSVCMLAVSALAATAVGQGGSQTALLMQVGTTSPMENVDVLNDVTTYSDDGSQYFLDRIGDVYDISGGKDVQLQIKFSAGMNQWTAAGWKNNGMRYMSVYNAKTGALVANWRDEDVALGGQNSSGAYQITYGQVPNGSDFYAVNSAGILYTIPNAALEPNSIYWVVLGSATCGNNNQRMLFAPIFYEFTTSAADGTGSVDTNYAGRPEAHTITVVVDKPEDDETTALQFNRAMGTNGTYLLGDPITSSVAGLIIPFKTTVKEGAYYTLTIKDSKGNDIPQAGYSGGGVNASDFGDIRFTMPNDNVTITLTVGGSNNVSLNTAPIEIGSDAVITFIDNAAWRAAVTAVKLDGTALDAENYTLEEGKLTIKAAAFTAAKDYTVTVEATGYDISSATQKVTLVGGYENYSEPQGAGLLVYMTTPAPVNIKTAGDTGDCFYNVIDPLFDATANIDLHVDITGSGSNNVTAALTLPYVKVYSDQARQNLVASYEDGAGNVIATGVSSPVYDSRGVNLTIRINAGTLDPDTTYYLAFEPGVYSSNGQSLGKTVVFEFKTAAADTKIPPALSAADTKRGVDVDITFTDDAEWVEAVTAVEVGETAVDADKYTFAAGKLTVAADVFPNAADYVVTVKAAGYDDARVAVTVFEKFAAVEFNVTDTWYQRTQRIQINAINTAESTKLYNAIRDTYGSTTPVIRFTQEDGREFLLGLSASGFQSNRIRIPANTFTAGGKHTVTISHPDWEDTVITVNVTYTAPEVTPDTTDIALVNDITLTFTDDGRWANAITSVKVNNVAVAAENYTVDAQAGTITIKAAAFETDNTTYPIVIAAEHYDDLTVRQFVGSDFSAPPEITAADTNITADAVLTYASDAAWVNNIYAVYVDGEAVTGYTKANTQLTIPADYFTELGDHTVVIKATGYDDATVTETIIPKKSVDAAVLRHYRSNVETGGDSSKWVVGGSNILQLDTPPDAAWANAFSGVLLNGKLLSSNDYRFTKSTYSYVNFLSTANTFTEKGTYEVTLNAKGYEDIVYSAYCYELAPLITPDTEDYALGSDIELTVDGNGISDDYAQSITQIMIGENEVIRPAYITAESGKITISSRAFSEPGEYLLTIKADGFVDRTITQFVGDIQLTPPELKPQYPNHPVYDQAFLNTSTTTQLSMATVDPTEDITAWANTLNKIEITSPSGAVDVVDNPRSKTAFNAWAQYCVVDNAYHGFTEVGEYTVTCYSDFYAPATFIQKIQPYLIASFCFNQQTTVPYQDVTFTATQNGLPFMLKFTGVEVNGEWISKDEMTVTSNSFVIPGKYFPDKGDYPVVLYAEGIGQGETFTQYVLGTAAPALTLTSTPAVNTAQTFTFTDDETWRAAVIEVTVNGEALEASKYTLAEGLLTIDGSVFASDNTEYAVAVRAPGYAAAAYTFVIGELQLLDAPTLVSAGTGFSTNNDVGFDLEPIADTYSDWFDAITSIKIVRSDGTVQDYNTPANISTRISKTDNGDGTITLSFKSMRFYKMDGTVTISAEGYKDTAFEQKVCSIALQNVVPDETDNLVGNDILISGFDASAGLAMATEMTTTENEVKVNGTAVALDKLTLYNEDGVVGVLIDKSVFTEAGSYQIEMTTSYCESNNYPVITVDQFVGIETPEITVPEEINLGADIEITFASNEAYQAAISGAVIDGAEVDSSLITVADGKVTIAGSAIDTVGNHNVEIVASNGYLPQSGTFKAVRVYVDGVTVDKETLALELEQESQINATIEPANASTQTLVWTSSDPDVATVDENGVVTAVGIGTAEITVMTTEGRYTATSTVTVGPKTYGVEFILTPEEATVTVTDNSGKTVEPTNEAYQLANGTYSYTATAAGYDNMTGSFTVANADQTITLNLKAQAPAVNPFVDVKSGDYFYDPVMWAVEHDPQITNGTDPTHFSPNATCTRAQIVTFLWRAKGCPEPSSTSNPFVDVKASDYYYKAVLWAVEQGVTSGMDATHFGPAGNCTRAQAVTFLWRAEGKPSVSGSNPFSDVKSGDYYYDAVLWAVEKDVTKGTDATHFSPGTACTRGQIVTFLYRDLAE